MRDLLWIVIASCLFVWLIWVVSEPLRRRAPQRGQDNGSGSISSGDSGYRQSDGDDRDGGSSDGGGGGGDGGGGGGGD